MQSRHDFLHASSEHFSICSWHASMQLSQPAIHTLHSETQFLSPEQQLSEQCRHFSIQSLHLLV
jgi:hypothetical protein